MNDDPPEPQPEEFHVVIERPQMFDEQWARFIARLLMKEVMRRHPQPRRTLTISFGDQPNFYIVRDQRKG
jgi:hypothetical protein